MKRLVITLALTAAAFALTPAPAGASTGIVPGNSYGCVTAAEYPRATRGETRLQVHRDWTVQAQHGTTLKTSVWNGHTYTTIAYPGCVKGEKAVITYRSGRVHSKSKTW